MVNPLDGNGSVFPLPSQNLPDDPASMAARRTNTSFVLPVWYGEDGTKGEGLLAYLTTLSDKSLENKRALDDVAKALTTLFSALKDAQSKSTSSALASQSDDPEVFDIRGLSNNFFEIFLAALGIISASNRNTKATMDRISDPSEQATSTAPDTIIKEGPKSTPTPNTNGPFSSPAATADPSALANVAGIALIVEALIKAAQLKETRKPELNAQDPAKQILEDQDDILPPDGLPVAGSPAPATQATATAITQLLEIFAGRNAILASLGAINTLGDNSGNFDINSLAIPAGLAVTFAQLINSNQTLESLGQNIQALLQEAFPGLNPAELAALTTFVQAAATFQLAANALNQLGGAVGIPDLLAQVLASSPEGRTLLGLLSQAAQLNSVVANVLTTPAQIDALISNLQKIIRNATDKQKQQILEAVKQAIATNAELKAEQLKQEIVRQLQNSADFTPEAAQTVADSAQNYIEAQATQGPTLAALTFNPTDTDVQYLTGQLVNEGINRDSANAAIIAALANGQTSQGTLISGVALSNDIAVQLVNGGIDPNLAYIAAANALIPNTRSPIFNTQSNTPEFNSNTLSNSVKDYLSPIIGEKKAQEIAQTYVNTTIDIKEKIDSSVKQIVEANDGKFSTEQSNELKTLLNQYMNGNEINQRIFNLGQVATGIMSDFHPKGNINTGIGDPHKRTIDINV